MQFQYPSSTLSPTPSTDSTAVSTGEQSTATTREWTTGTTSEESAVTPEQHLSDHSTTNPQLAAATEDWTMGNSTAITPEPLSHSTAKQVISTGETYDRTASPGKIPTDITDTDYNESKFHYS